MAILQMRGIRKAFGATQALDGVDLDVNTGEVHALIGENGAGKSTLMKILSGAISPDSGTIKLDGKPYKPMNPREGRLHGIAMIYQELALAPHLTVAENIFLGNEPTSGPFVRRSEIFQRSRDALAQVGRPDIAPTMRVDQLSIADQQLVEIARSVATGCKVLVLDEPTSSVTSRDVENLFALIRRLKNQGIAIVYISHFLEEITQISDRYTVLRDGKFISSGNTSLTTPAEIVSRMVGREIEDLYHRSERTPEEVILEVNNLSGRKLPKQSSLQLRRGEVLGIAGLLGSGRTELIRAIFRLDPVRSGVIQLGSMQATTPNQMWSRGAGIVSEDRKQEGLALNLSIAENMTLPKLNGLGPLGLVFPGHRRKVCLPLAEQMSVKCRSVDQQVGKLSGGNQQKVAIARLLHADVDVLILDEPTRGIDVGSKASIYQLIDKLVTTPGTNGKKKAVLLISSYLPELLGTCDRIQVMQRGTLMRAKAATSRTEHEIMMEATGVTRS